MKVCILGSGAYGLALSHIFNNNCNEIILWTFSEYEEDELLKKRRSSKLNNYILHKNIDVTTDIEKALENSSLIVIAVPTHALKSVLKEIKQYYKKTMNILIASKGLENVTGKFTINIVKEELKTKKVSIISGPTIASDIVDNNIIGLTLAGTNKKTNKIIKEILKNDNLIIEETKDIIGVQICGTIKNILGIASGILSSMNISDSTYSLFLTKALSDTKNLIYKLGGDKSTILTLSGIGDIFLTSTSINSRNFTYGNIIGKNQIKEAEEYAKNNTIEGLYSLTVLKKLMEKHNTKMNLITIINDIINNKKGKDELLNYIKESR